MLFRGIGRTFSTENDRQFETIGAFWDELAAKYGRANLQGLGYGWTEESIEYVIGLIDGKIDGANRAGPWFGDKQRTLARSMKRSIRKAD